MIWSLRILTADGKSYIENECVQFRIEKEAYTPYSRFEGIFVSSWRDLSNVSRVQFIYGVKTIHDGMGDSIEIYRQDYVTFLKVVSTSFSSMLCQNQTAPGMRTNLRFSDLSSEFASIPNVYFESTPRLNYIYIKEGSTMWDAAVNFSFRLNGTYPYVTSANLVRTTPAANNQITVENRNIIKTGITYDRTKMISDISMQDIEGNYNSYTLKNENSALCNIIRKKQIPLDMQYLNDPQSALDYRIKFSMRSFKCTYAVYAGYLNEDLYDLMTIENVVEQKRVHKIIITGNNAQVRTFVGTYEDGFLL